MSIFSKKKQINFSDDVHRYTAKGIRQSFVDISRFNDSTWCVQYVNVSAKRLHISMDKYTIEIIPNNPATVVRVISNVEFISPCVSICNKSDEYDYRQGILIALSKFAKLYKFTKEDRAKMYEKLFKKYPTLKENK